eukprot:m.101741 g.101741  ORF g.101741 m.101741 type:complete len:524 (-) comp15475_c0_seq1:17-1588(-)
MSACTRALAQILLTLVACTSALTVTPTCPSSVHGTDCLDYCGRSYDPLIPNLAAADQGAYKLRQVQVLIRHGSRTQGKKDGLCWPEAANVPFDCPVNKALEPEVSEIIPALAAPGLLFRWSNYKTFPDLSPATVSLINGTCIPNQLLPIGYYQQQLNGKGLSEAYVGNTSMFDFFDPMEAADDVFLLSDTDYRTIASGQTLFKHMFPALNEQSATSPVASRLYDWHVAPDHDAGLIVEYAPHVCPEIKAVVDKKAVSPEVTKRKKKLTSAAKPVLERLGLTPASMSERDIGAAVDCLTVFQCNGKPLPAGVTVDDVELLFELRQATELEMYTDREFSSYAAAIVLTSLRENLQAAAVGASGSDGAPKFALFSGHDITLFPVLGALLNTSVQAWPQYADLLALELWELATSPGTMYVRAVYHGQAQPLFGCPEQASGLCPLTTVLGVTITPPTAAQCAATSPSPSPPMPATDGSCPNSHDTWRDTALVFIVISALLTLVLCGLLCQRGTSNRRTGGSKLLLMDD